MCGLISQCVKAKEIIASRSNENKRMVFPSALHMIFGVLLPIAVFLTGCTAPQPASRPARPVTQPTSRPARPATQPISGSSGPFQAQRVPHLQQPEVVVNNQSNKQINLTLSGATSRSVVIPAFSSQSVSVPSGSYTYRATAEGVVPASGRQFFQSQHRYTWTFSIRTTTTRQ